MSPNTYKLQLVGVSIRYVGVAELQYNDTVPCIR